ncbi:carboxymuconolactone decarboxylase family protein [Massilia sp. ST3]|uniref:carboxymuconolactone decarboxylase family protein n=1 Tax=Massilia sp. ST3 TaxID=2824903 RepID=UPI001B8161D1|nr:carboxymuconolactone decarboxylase family protein [Massilia sp. ST3]MBQ5949156.1 carboxymuconolactone decarboxylase family protein [Massilia sp. ST3]
MTSLRLPYYSLSPAAYRALAAAETAVEASPLGKQLVRLVFLRVSQINGCAFCVDKHARDLAKGGEDFQRINSLVTWRETEFYTARERAALAWAEAATRLEHGEVPDGVFLPLKEHFTEQEISDLGFATALMNAWNRMAIGFRQPVARAAFPD